MRNLSTCSFDSTGFPNSQGGFADKAPRRSDRQLQARRNASTLIVELVASPACLSCKRRGHFDYTEDEVYMDLAMTDLDDSACLSVQDRMD